MYVIGVIDLSLCLKGRQSPYYSRVIGSHLVVSTGTNIINIDHCCTDATEYIMMIELKVIGKTISNLSSYTSS